MNDKVKQYKQQLDSNLDNYLDLWKYFTDDAGKIKDKMWTITAFFCSALGALLTFAGTRFFKNKDDFTFQNINHEAMLGIIAVIGCITSGFSIFMIKKYGDHIRSCWNRANYIRFKIEGLSEIWCYDDPELIKEDEKLKMKMENSTPKVAIRLMMIMAFYFLVFFVLGVVVLIWN